MDTKTQQLNILMTTIRDIVKAKTCPEWIIKKLTEGVKKAKTLQNTDTNDNNYEIDNVYREFTIGEQVISNVENDQCLYEIIDKSDPINGINLFTVKIIKGNKNNPAGYIIYNVPETMLYHIKG